MPTFTMNEKESAFSLFHRELTSRPTLQEFMKCYDVSVEDRTIEDDSIYNNLFYISDSKITAKSDLVRFMTDNDYQMIKTIRFWIFSNDEHSLLIEGGINMTIETPLLPELNLYGGLKFEYPKEELNTYRRHHKYFDWHQDMTAVVSSLDDAVLLLVDTIEKLCEQSAWMRRFKHGASTSFI